jgi:hypothetical protein
MTILMALGTCFAARSPHWISGQASGAFLLGALLGAASFPRGLRLVGAQQCLPRNLRPQCRLNATSPLCSFILLDVRILRALDAGRPGLYHQLKACQVTVLPGRMHICTKTNVDGLLQRACNLARNMHILG